MWRFAIAWTVIWLPVLYVLIKDKVHQYFVLYCIYISLLIGACIGSMLYREDGRPIITYVFFILLGVLFFPVVALCGWLLRRIYSAIVYREVEDLIVSAYVFISVSIGLCSASLSFPEWGKGDNIAFGVRAGAISFIALTLAGYVVQRACFAIVPRIARRKQNSA